MKVLFLIPKNNPPTLEGNYSKPLKEFVEACLNKEPSFVSVPLSVVSSRGEFALWGLFQSLLAVSLISHNFADEFDFFKLRRVCCYCHFTC